MFCCLKNSENSSLISSLPTLKVTAAPSMKCSPVPISCEIETVPFWSVLRVLTITKALPLNISIETVFALFDKTLYWNFFVVAALPLSAPAKTAESTPVPLSDTVMLLL